MSTRKPTQKPAGASKAKSGTRQQKAESRKQKAESRKQKAGKATSESRKAISKDAELEELFAKFRQLWDIETMVKANGGHEDVMDDVLCAMTDQFKTMTAHTPTGLRMKAEVARWHFFNGDDLSTVEGELSEKAYADQWIYSLMKDIATVIP